MAIAILVLALVAYLYVLLVYPEYRTAALAAGGAVAAGLGAYFWLNDPDSSGSAWPIEPDEIALADMRVEPSLRGFTMTGQVENRSTTFRLAEVELDLRLHDCPTENTAPEECPVIGESHAIARPDVPPGESRSFTARFIVAGMPEPEGTLRWTSSVTDIHAPR